MTALSPPLHEMPVNYKHAATVSIGLWIGLGVSFAAHGLFLMLNFTFPEASRAFQDRALEVILVNSKSARKPVNPQALGQANLDGGGNSEQDRRIKTPLPVSPQEKTGNAVEEAQKRVETLEARQQQLLNQVRKQSQLQKQALEQRPEPQPSSGTGLNLSEMMEQARHLEGEIARNTEEYNKRPRIKHLGSRVEEYRFAQYIENWRQKVERVGTLNYPESAKGKLSGSLRLSVKIKHDGSVESITVERGSGHQILDDAARRIIYMASPFSAFPPNIRQDFDVVEITRVFTFTASNQIETSTR